MKCDNDKPSERSLTLSILKGDDCDMLQFLRTVLEINNLLNWSENIICISTLVHHTI